MEAWLQIKNDNLVLNEALKTTEDLDCAADLSHNYCNITATLSTRKGNAQPWRFFFACTKALVS